jgi:hypothetical protein
MMNNNATANASVLYDVFIAEVQRRSTASGAMPSAIPAELIEATLPVSDGWAVLDTLKSWLDSFRPLPPAVVAELKQLYTVRLTYHSNAIEGNTLSQNETEMILSHGVTIGGKTVIEHLEVIGHRDAMRYMEELAAQSTPVGEWEIKNLHSLILLPVDGASGTSEAGRYRTLDVRAAGTEHIYPPHYQVPTLMTEFATWLVSDTAKKLHPVELATQAHYRLVSIHPFRDGNGRAGRLLMNLFLVRAGYPIAIITNNQRIQYLNALVYGQSHEDDASQLTALIAQACRESMMETLALLSTAGDSRGMGAPFYRALVSQFQTDPQNNTP